MTPVQLVTIFAENKPGQLARVTDILARAGINIRCATIASSESFGVIKLLVDQSDRAVQQLKQQGVTVSLVDVLAVEVEDQPGGLHAIAECLSRHQVNIENASGFVANRRAVLLVEVKDIARARQVLETQRFRLLSAEELLQL